MTLAFFRLPLAASALALMTLAPPPAAAANGPASEVGTLAGAYLAAGFAQRHAAMADATALISHAQMLDPESGRLLHRRFALSVGIGEIERAAGFARSLVQTDIADPLIPTVLLIDAARRGDYAQALDILDTVPRHGIPGLTRPLMAGWLHAGEGNRADALAAIDTLIERPGFEGLARVHRGLVLWHLGDLESAATALEEALERGVSLRLVLSLAGLYQALGEQAAALALLEDFREEPGLYSSLDDAFDAIAAGTPYRTPVVGVAEGLAEIAYEVGRALTGQEAAEIALDHLRLALYLRPEFAEAQLLLGDVLMEIEEYALARDTYAAIPDDGPTGEQARLRVARALEAMGDGDAATAHLETILATFPDDPDAWATLGDLHRFNRRFEEAVTAYDAAVDLVTFDNASWSLLYRRGMALERASDWPRAERDLLRAIELNPDHAHLLNYLGYSWIDRGKNLEEGEELIREAVAMLPDDGYIVDSLGWIYYLTGRMERAVEVLERAVALLPADPVINDHLGDAYWRVGRTREATFQWNRALRTAEDPELIEAIESKLRDGLAPLPPPTTASEANGAAARPAERAADRTTDSRDL